MNTITMKQNDTFAVFPIPSLRTFGQIDCLQNDLECIKGIDFTSHRFGRRRAVCRRRGHVRSTTAKLNEMIKISSHRTVFGQPVNEADDPVLHRLVLARQSQAVRVCEFLPAYAWKPRQSIQVLASQDLPTTTQVHRQAPIEAYYVDLVVLGQLSGNMIYINMYFEFLVYIFWSRYQMSEVSNCT